MGFKSSWFFALSVGFFVSSAAADPAPTLPGFGGGSPLPGGEVTLSSVTVAELDGDSSNGLETISGSAQGILHATRADGSALWSYETPNARCGGANNRLLSSPAVGALFGDGVPYVVVGYGGVGHRNCDGGVIAVDGRNGALRWKLSLRDLAKRERFFSFSPTVFSTPALADTDGDGKMEIAFGSFDRQVYLLEADGSIRWYYQAADTVWSSPAFADVNGDGRLEVVIGTDISANSRLRPVTKNGGYVYALPTAKRRTKKVGFRDRSFVIWQTAFDQTMFSSPVIADVLADNPGPEIIIGSGCFFPQGRANKNGKWVRVIRMRDGRVLRTLPTAGCLSSNVAVADLDDDGEQEIVATVNGSRSIGGDGYGRVTAFKLSRGVNPIWSVAPFTGGQNNDMIGNYNSPVIGDVDGNGSLEVVVSNTRGIAILEGRNGRTLTCESGGCSGGLPDLTSGATLQSTPALVDVNQDGVLDIVAAGRKSGVGAIFTWTHLAGKLGSLPGAKPAYSAPWAMFRGNATRNGRPR